MALPDVCRFYVLFDGVDHFALFVDHGGQVLEDGVYVNDVRLQLTDRTLAFLKKLKNFVHEL